MPEQEALWLRLRIIFEQGGKDAPLDFYDGAQSLFGFAKTINLSVHYFLNRNVAFQAPAVKGCKVYMRPSRDGSFEQLLELAIQNEIIASIGLGITGSAIYDFLKYSVGRAIGRPPKPATSQVQTIASEAGSDLDALSEALDGPLREAHRAISQHGGATRLSGEKTDLVTFDAQTLDYVTTRIVSSKVEKRKVSIASFNINSRTGRLYDPELGRTVPFEQDKQKKIKNPTPLSWSLDQSNRGLPGVIEVEVRQVTTIRNEIKKFIMSDCRRL